MPRLSQCGLATVWGWAGAIALSPLFSFAVAAPAIATPIPPHLVATLANVPGSSANETDLLPPSELLQQGWAAYQQVDYSTALDLWQQALIGFQQQGDRAGELLTYEALGIGAFAVHDYATAIAYHQAQLDLAQATSDQAAEARSLANLGNVYQRLGNFSQALRLQESALALWQALGDTTNQGKMLTNLGNLYLELGNFARARWYHQQGYEQVQQTADPFGEMLALYGLGIVATHQNDQAAAQAYYTASLTIAQQLNQADIAAQIYINLGAVSWLANQPEQAIAAYEQALALGQSQPRIAGMALSGRASIHLLQANYTAALQDQIRSWDYLQTLDEPVLSATALKNWAEILWQSGEIDEAAIKLQETLAYLEPLRESLSDRDQVAIFDTQQTTYSLFQQVLMAQGETAAALEMAERGRAQAFAAQLADRLPRVAPVDQPGQPRQERPPAPVATDIGGMEAEPLAAAGEQSSPLVSEDFTIAQMQAVARSLSVTIVEYSLIPDDRALTLGSQQGDYIALLIWVMQPDGRLSTHTIDLKETPLDLGELVLRSRREIGVRGRSVASASPRGAARTATLAETTADADVFVYRQLRRLHDLLISPIADSLPTDPTQPVVIVPHQELFLVPFAALQQADGRYLIEHHTLTTAPSIQVLALTEQLQRQRSPAPWQAADWLIVGNPIMPEVSDAAGNRAPLDPLPGAEQEAIAIAALVQATPLIGAAATESTVVQQMSQARVIHLATHGLLDYGQPSQFGVRDLPGAIALTPTADTDGLLTSSELTELELQADLAVLSACDTGRGTITGDGVIGLSRSLMTAGVPSVMVSLWSVPDDPTAVLMQTFYQQLQDHGDRAQALRQAMLATKAQYPAPQDWAAFTLLGAAAPPRDDISRD